MAIVGLELAIILLLIALNGVLAMAELAIVSARRARLQHRAEEGDRGADAALALAAEPARFLSTVQIGITMVGILAGALGGATLAEKLAVRIEDLGPGQGASEALAVAAVVAGITYFTLVFGELVPKRIALRFPEELAGRLARPLSGLSRVTAPLVRVLSASTEAVVRAIGIRGHAPEAASEEEIALLVRESTEAGVLEPAEQAMVTSIFRLGDRAVADLMTPRPAVVWLDVGEPSSEAWDTIAASQHSLFPVARDDLDEILGVVEVRDLWAGVSAGRRPDLVASARPALFVPETAPVFALLELFRGAGTELAVVVDEHGGTAGIVTCHRRAGGDRGRAAAAGRSRRSAHRRARRRLVADRWRAFR